MLHSDYSIDFIYRQKPKQLASFLFASKKKRDEEKVWELWLATYPSMTEDNFVHYQDFYDSIMKPKEDKKPNKPAQQFVKETFAYFKDKVKKVV